MGSPISLQLFVPGVGVPAIAPVTVSFTAPQLIGTESGTHGDSGAPLAPAVGSSVNVSLLARGLPSGSGAFVSVELQNSNGSSAWTQLGSCTVSVHPSIQGVSRVVCPATRGSGEQLALQMRSFTEPGTSFTSATPALSFAPPTVTSLTQAPGNLTFSIRGTGFGTAGLQVAGYELLIVQYAIPASISGTCDTTISGSCGVLVAVNCAVVVADVMANCTLAQGG